jgi:hypothetical protein
MHIDKMQLQIRMGGKEKKTFVLKECASGATTAAALLEG